MNQRGVQSQKFRMDAARGPRLGLPQDAAARKRTPIARGVLDYFPAALAAVAEISLLGNKQHNIGEELHWARGKSQDHADCIARHLVERGSIDVDGGRHSAKLAWRALALLQTELEEEAKEETHEVREPVQMNGRTAMLPTPEEVLRRVQRMEGGHDRP